MKQICFFIIIVVSMWFNTALAQLDSIRTRLLNAPVQEKVFLHLDNTCYFKGDTIWYKAYVTRADDLHYTDMSRIMYVELVSPDGMVVERQNLIVSDIGYGNGNFAIKDTLYSGYYELRAYTRWMMNFCVTERPFKSFIREYFYNSRMAHDFFRQFGTVYSRVIPIYERPDSVGDYLSKYVIDRPKTRIYPEEKPEINVSFYPEGGHIIAGVSNNVAFEVTDEQGRNVSIEGQLTSGNKSVAEIRTEHQGRGSFVLDAANAGRAEATFIYNNKEYSFKLPKAEHSGCALQLTQTADEVNITATLRDVPLSGEFAAAIICRGVLKAFEPVVPDADGHVHLSIDNGNLPTGVNNLVIIDQNGSPLADRLFFVNHHDYDTVQINVEGLKTEYDPTELVELSFQAPAGTPHLSIAVRDGLSDEPTYDTGNMLTDLLLSSELKGFVADPAYYFASSDAEHQRALDLLMMVQGWRRYEYDALISTAPLRYQPEVNMTVEGGVYKMRSFDDVQPGEVGSWKAGVGGIKTAKEAIQELQMDTSAEEDFASSDNAGIAVAPVASVPEAAGISNPDPYFGIDNKNLKYEVTVAGELVVGSDIAEVEMETTDGGHFIINVPPYYGDGILFLSAHKSDISEKKLHKLENKDRMNEDAWPEFYVKRDLFYPIYPKPYSYYQNHQPDTFLSGEYVQSADGSDLGFDLSTISSMDRKLDDIEVDGRRRRGRSRIDYSKPLCAYDTYYLYNMATDYGLSHGKLNFRLFPMQVSILLLGNYNGIARTPNIVSRFDDGYLFFRSYKPATAELENDIDNRSVASIYNQTKLSRQLELRIHTDFDLRNPDKYLEQSIERSDITMNFVLMPNDGHRRTYRDRRIILPGIYRPDSYYSPDYGRYPLPEGGKDYRRTLYWNPNAPLDADGRFTARFYTNTQPTKLRVSVAGLTPDGKPVVTDQ